MTATTSRTPSLAALPRAARVVLSAVLTAALTAGLTAGVLAAPAAAADPNAESAFVTAVNQARAARGIPALQVASDLVSVARAQSDRMASSNTLYHNPNLSTDVTSWTRLSENVGYGGSVDQVQAAFMASSGHAANILDRGVSQVGIGVTWSGGRLWVTQVFRQPSSSYVAPTSTPTPTSKLWLLRQSAAAGSWDAGFLFGSPGDTTLSCDFTGTGRDTTAVYRDGWWAIRTSPGPGPASAVFQYGDRSMRPVCGDWDGDGKDGIGVYDALGVWWLRETPSAGAPHRRFQYGWGGATPVVGRWKSTSGADGIGVYDGGLWMLRTSATPGAANAAVVRYGWRGAVPVPGDWDGDGDDTLGVYSDGGWWVRNYVSAGAARTFAYGARGYSPVVGDWDGVGKDGIAVTRPQ